MGFFGHILRSDQLARIEVRQAKRDRALLKETETQTAMIERLTQELKEAQNGKHA